MNRCRIVCVLLFAVFTLPDKSDGSGELKLLQTVFRHGDRAPDDLRALNINFYPNDPYNDKDWYPVPYGGLTNTGKERAFELGKFYRKKYGQWLGYNKHPDVVKFFRSLSYRAEETAQMVAGGLFPPQPHERWSDTLNWQPIPTTKIAGKNNWFYYGSVGMCTNFEKLMETAEKTEPKLITYYKEHDNFYKYLAKHAGRNGTYLPVLAVHATLVAERELGLKLPNWTQGLLPEGPLQDAAGMVHVIRGFNDELRKFGAGIWLKTLLENIDNFTHTENPKRKAYFWSGHDQNIADLLVAFDAFDEPHVPPYCSAIMLELREIKQKYYIKVLYKRDNNTEPLIIPGCNSVLCPLEVFRNEFKSIIPEDPAKLCGRLYIT